MKEKNNTFLEYLKNDKFYTEIYKKILFFCRTHKDLLLDKISNGYNISYIKEVDEDLDINYKNVYIDSKPGSRIDFDIAVEVNVPVIGVSGKHRDYDIYTSCLWVLVCCTGTLEKKLNDFRIINVEDFVKGVPNKPLSGDLIPYIRKNEYDKYATEFLKLYYPEALIEPQEINVNKLAEKMGLQIYSTSITRDKKIFGQVFFDDTVVPLYNKITDTYESYYIKKDSIIIDDEATYLRSYGSRNMTLVHECLHSYLHRKAFQFAQIINSDLKYIQCQVDGVIKGEVKNSQTEWMEIQANGITPHVLMPYKPFKAETERILEEYDFNSSKPYLDIIEDVISTLSRKFGTTIYATRKRLIDIGFEPAIGAFNWIDDHYIRPYTFKKGTLTPTETYSISYKDVFHKLLASNSPIVIAFMRGDIQFVENHLIVNSDMYIKKNEKGDAILTEYARYHMDECCIKFKYKSINGFSVGSELGLMCYLCRDCTKEIEFDLTISKDLPSILKDPSFSSKYRIHRKNVNEVCNVISRMTFCEILNYLMEYLSIDVKELVYDSGLSDKTIRRYLKPAIEGGNKVPQKRTVIAILRALNLPMEICEICIKQAKIAFASNDLEDDALLNVMQLFRAGTYKDADKFLSTLGYDPISEPKN